MENKKEYYYKAKFEEEISEITGKWKMRCKEKLEN